MHSDDPADAESRAAFDTLGKPMQEMYKAEAEKYKRDEQDQKELHEALLKAKNVHTVDF